MSNELEFAQGIYVTRKLKIHETPASKQVEDKNSNAAKIQ